MKKITLALAAHVDAGKTTLAEALLHQAGVLRVPGRVDKGDTVMDHAEAERRRGITIFAGEASLPWNGAEIGLLDTPGHVDFSPEAERALLAADAALLIISGLDGVQAHTRSLWQLLARRGLPVLVFVSKMDSGRRTREDLLEDLKESLKAPFLPWEVLIEGGEETVLLDENLLEQYLAGGAIGPEVCADLIRRRKVFPVFFGSGLKGEGLEPLLEAACLLAQEQEEQETRPFRGLVYKIDFDEKGARQTHVKVLAGTVAARDSVETGGPAPEKISFLRRYTGGRFTQTERLGAGSLGVLMGLEGARPGDILGGGGEAAADFFEPVMRYRLHLPDGVDADTAYAKLAPLGEEDPSLNLRFAPGRAGLTVDLMGPVQQEILTERIRAMTGWDVRMEEGSILYRETVSGCAEGVGHYEPLRHYAEVHVALRTLPRGTGLVIRDASDPRKLEPVLAAGIVKLLALKTHRGVLTGAPVTDMEIALLGAKDHEKHTEGGDMREAAFRAVRQGLMTLEARGQARLLEPYQNFRLLLPPDKLGRALSELKARACEAEQEGMEADLAIMTGRGPAASLLGYDRELAAYTGGRARLQLWNGGYDLCHNTEEVIAAAGYSAEADREDPCDSVFCAHGAGFSVPWDQVPDYMHLPYLLPTEDDEPAGPKTAPSAGPAAPHVRDPRAADAELEAIMLREFGPIKRPVVTGVTHTNAGLPRGPEFLSLPAHTYLIDGYNLIFFWPEMKELAAKSLENAREQLLRRLQNYAAFADKKMLAVFDGYRVGGGAGETQELPHLTVIYTKEHETADMLIERFLAENKKTGRYAVVSNDNLIRLAAIRQGALRVRCEEFLDEYAAAIASLQERMEQEGGRIGSKLVWKE
ncbi:MAG: TetM/TetW/TetO/TetS family tetracycline resistance ribosomal protection protein [Lachnospiraceae bacterium]|nr:TetM/TetW/TetO/TetS family tetracycline resistance ribosomal protection protein [Lachnospiraceae bacterium]